MTKRKLGDDVEEIKKTISPRILPNYLPQQIPRRLYDNSK
jgi:hypothetical protein